jgi:hypothetical protein
MKGLVIWVGILASMGLFASTDAESLRATLDNIELVQSEKNVAGKILTPSITVGGHKFREPVIRISKLEKTYLATPLSGGEATLKQAYLSLETGGVYIEEGSGTRYLKLDGNPVERLFLRQFAYLLQQRHPSDPSTAKFFKFYFGIDNAPAKERISKALASPLSDTTVEGTVSLGAITTEEGEIPTLDQLFHYMQYPAEWKGLRCSEKNCVYQHATLGTIELRHPGAADLTFTDEDLVNPEDEKPVDATEVQTKSELEQLLEKQPADVTVLYVLISHEECGPCKRLKKVGGLWSELVRRVRRGKLKHLALFVENARTPNFAPSNLVSQLALPRGYPQLVIFERTSAGAWTAPKHVGASEIERHLKQ